MPGVNRSPPWTLFATMSSTAPPAPLDWIKIRSIDLLATTRSVLQSITIEVFGFLDLILFVHFRPSVFGP